MSSSIPKLKFHQLNIIEAHEKLIRSMAIFPSYNIITVSGDQKIKIWVNNETNFNILQIIDNAHKDEIISVSIKNENNFATCSKDKSIKTWIKENNKYKENIIIKNAHNDWINKVIFCENENIISSSDDKTIKIWEKNPYKKLYQILLIISNYNTISTLSLIKNKNLFIAFGYEGTKIYNMNNFQLIYHIKDSKCYNTNGICILDEDRIIVGCDDENNIKIISLSEKKTIFNIKFQIMCCGICCLKKKGVFLIAGFSNNINVYRNDNYECVFNFIGNENLINFGLFNFNENFIISLSYRCLILYSLDVDDYILNKKCTDINKESYI